MLELQDWSTSTRFPPKPWLVIGKGPTFDRREEFDLSAYNTLALNHVVNAMTVDVAHMIDIDVIEDCAEHLRTNCRWLLMPRYPHVRSEASSRSLEDWFDTYAVLRDLDVEGRLVWYNLSGGPVVGRSPVIGAKRFSSEAALGILARLGVKDVRTLGIDGGRAYAREFDDVVDRTLLANGASSFDEQNARLLVIAEEHGIEHRPLVEPLRIFIGSDDSQIVAHRVLEYSIRTATTYPVEVMPMLDLSHPTPRDAVNRARTPFSYYRFMIPELAGYRGRALYLDADMLVFGDIAELAQLPFEGRSVLCTAPAPTERWDGHGGEYLGRRSVAVMLLDCDRLRWRIDEIVAGLDEGRFIYDELLSELSLLEPGEVADTIPEEWNELERYEPGRTKLLHYTVVPTQPWKSDDNPLGEIWMSYYRDAVAAGAVPPDEVEALIAAGHVKPSLRSALRLAPSRQAVFTGAASDVAASQRRVRELEAAIASMRASWSWRIGDAIVKGLRTPRNLVRSRRG